ncbi:MAG: VOC family protein [Planctomycetes bacterium]|nr:VOC family protein [Planctomycetota bacterium]
MAVSPVPPGHHTVTPHLVLRNTAAALEFYKKAFGAVEIMRMPGPGGKGIMHAEIMIGDSFVYLADEWPGIEVAAPEKYGGTTVSIHLYVKDVDALFNQAVAAGAKVTMPIMNMFWGDRFGKLLDPFGHSWSIATHVEDVPPEEMGKRADAAMKQMAQGKK